MATRNSIPDTLLYAIADFQRYAVHSHECSTVKDRFTGTCNCGYEQARQRLDVALSTTPPPVPNWSPVALTAALEYDVTPLQWLQALMSDIEEIIDWDKVDDPDAITTAIRESKQLTRTLAAGGEATT